MQVGAQSYQRCHCFKRDHHFPAQCWGHIITLNKFNICMCQSISVINFVPLLLKLNSLLNLSNTCPVYVVKSCSILLSSLKASRSLYDISPINPIKNKSWSKTKIFKLCNNVQKLQVLKSNHIREKNLFINTVIKAPDKREL